MPNSTSKPLADDVLNWIKGTTFPAAPATLWVGLFATAPTANTASGTEISGSSYARQSVASSAWTAIAQSADTIHDQISNTGAINFPVVTTTAYTVNGIGIFDAVTAGNLLLYIAVTGVLINVSSQYTIPINDLVIEV